MPAGAVQATVSANLGAGQASGTIILQNVVTINFRFADGVFEVIQSDPPKLTQFQYSAVTTVTFTPASKTVAIS
jgi:hypothetical protein